MRRIYGLALVIALFSSVLWIRGDIARKNYQDRNSVLLLAVDLIGMA